MTDSTVLVGGPMHGKVYAVRNLLDPIFGAEMDPRLLVADPESWVQPRRLVYEPTRLNIFGGKGTVHVLGRLNEQTRNWCLGDLLLSDLGKLVLGAK